MNKLNLAVLLLAISCAGGLQHTRTQREVVVTSIRVAHANVHLVEIGSHAVLVDSGYEDTAPEVAHRLIEAGVERLDAIVLTHGHADHAGGAAFLAERFGAAVYAGVGDRAMLASGTNNERLCPTGRRARRRVEDDRAQRFTPLVADVWVDEEIQLFEDTPLRILPMPGHTQGSVVVLLHDAALVGDLFRGSILGSSAETHFYMCDLADNRHDIEALLDAHPEVEHFFPGHFGPLSREAVKSLAEDMDR